MSRASVNFPLDLPWIRPYFGLIRTCARHYGLSPAIVAGVMSRESGGGRLLKPKGPGGTGDGGRGRGLMQIDIGSHEFARSGNWQEPAANIDYGCKLLSGYIRKAGSLRRGIAYYNTGASALTGSDPDATTTDHDYSADVIERANLFAPELGESSPIKNLFWLGLIGLALTGRI